MIDTRFSSVGKTAYLPGSPDSLKRAVPANLSYLPLDRLETATACGIGAVRISGIKGPNKNLPPGSLMVS